MRYSLVLAGVIVFCRISLGVAQPTSADGMYVVIEKKKDCPNLVFEFDQKAKHCVSQRPIISSKEFKSISPVIHDTVEHIKTTILELSTNGFNTWKGFIKSLPGTKLALIIDGKVVGIFKNEEGEIPTIKIPISGPDNGPLVDWIYDNLKKTIPINEKD